MHLLNYLAGANNPDIQTVYRHISQLSEQWHTIEAGLENVVNTDTLWNPIIKKFMRIRQVHNSILKLLKFSKKRDDFTSQTSPASIVDTACQVNETRPAKTTAKTQTEKPIVTKDRRTNVKDKHNKISKNVTFNPFEFTYKPSANADFPPGLDIILNSGRSALKPPFPKPLSLSLSLSLS